jgi:ABC-type transporter Mla subunit MlaD
VRRNWLLAALVAVIAVIVAAVVIVRATDEDSGNLETSAWADSVCTSIADWRSSITSLADVSEGTLSRDSLRERLDDAQAATEELVSDLRDLDPPQTEAGDELEQELDAAADEFETSFENLKTRGEEALDTDSTAEFLRALADLAPDAQGLLTSVATIIDTLESTNVPEESRDEVRQAFEDSEQCQALRSEED